jgi:hypothetical protein
MACLLVVAFAWAVAAVYAGPTLRMAECDSSSVSQVFYNGTENEIIAKVAEDVLCLDRSQQSSLLL